MSNFNIYTLCLHILGQITKRIITVIIIIIMNGSVNCGIIINIYYYFFIIVALFSLQQDFKIRTEWRFWLSWIKRRDA